MFIETIAPIAVLAEPLDTGTAGGALIRLLHQLTASPTTLQLLWFGLIAVLWIGYLVLEGFDFGVGMLLPILGKNDKERRAMLSSIGPFWDGNEVWLLTAGGATFAAFPEWYATLFSAAYIPLFIILLGLIVRAVAFEYRGKIDKDSWRKLWDTCIIVGSLIPSILWGAAFSILVAGVPAAVNPAQIGPSKVLFDGGFWDLIFAGNGFALVGGVCLTLLFLTHGAIFTSLKTEGDLRERAERLSPKLAIAATVVAAIWAVWLTVQFSNNPVFTWITVAVAAIALVLVVLTTLAKKFGLSFTFMTVALLAAVVTIFGALFPNVINGSKVTVRGDLLTDPVLGTVIYGSGYLELLPEESQAEVLDTVGAIAGLIDADVETVVGIVDDGAADLAGAGWSQDDVLKLLGTENGLLLGHGADITKLVDGGLPALDGVIANANLVLGQVVQDENFLAQLEMAPDSAKTDDGTGFAPLDGTITGLPMVAAASTEKTLTIMTWVAVIMTPIVLLYQGWSLWVFRRRIHADRIPEASGLVLTKE